MLNVLRQIGHLVAKDLRIEARSRQTLGVVIVLGMVYPEPNLGRAGEPPADAAGPYAFSQYQVTRDIAVDAMMIARELEHRGYRAAVTYDVCGCGSMTENPRFDTPDVFCNRFAASAAGLAVIGYQTQNIYTILWIAIRLDRSQPYQYHPLT